jgi:drug/metabolite transporter (DMT)-like permease
MAIGQSNSPPYPIIMNEQRVTGIVLLSMIFAGSNVAFGRILSADLSSVAIGFFSLAVALLAVLPLQISRRDELRRLSRRDWMHMLYQAFFGIVLFRILTVEGVARTSSIEAGIILSATPAAMTILAVLILKERPHRRKLFAVALTVVALILVNLGPGATAEGRPVQIDSEERSVSEIVDDSTVSKRNRLIGNMLILSAVFSDSLMTIFRRKSGQRVSHVTNTTVLVTTSFIIFGLAVLVERPSIGSMTGETLLVLAAIGVFGTTLGYLLWGYGAARIPAATTAVTVAALPITAVVLGVILLDEVVTIRHVTGATVGIAGMVLGALPTKESTSQDA